MQSRPARASSRIQLEMRAQSRLMAVCAERGAAARDREIGAGDDAERAVKGNGQHAAQGGERAPHLGMLHEIGEVFVGGETEARGGAIDHGIHRIGERAPAQSSTAAMTRIFTASSGSATPNTACMRLRQPGIVGARNRLTKGARTRPSSEMLAAPSTNAVQTLTGGPGRSPAATTSHSISSAGAMAAVPITVGRASSRFIWIADRPFFADYVYAACVTTDRRTHAIADASPAE